MASEPSVLRRRRAGVLLHLSSLPARGLGPDAYRFVDWLSAAGCAVWQLLPIGPVEPHGSPYQLRSSAAGHPGYIDLAEVGRWLDLQVPQSRSIVARNHFLGEAAAAFAARAAAGLRAEYDAFVSANVGWLDDVALFESLRSRYRRRAWWRWPDGLAERDPRALAAARREHAERIEQHRFAQFAFDRQWRMLRHYAAERGVLLFGDLPLYVAEDSVELWAHREYFRWNEAGAEVIAGVPPDYFSEAGQVWGNPLYDWSRLKADGFGWWVGRVRRQLALFDLLRIDHFRGLESCWEVPADSRDARQGRWRSVPGDRLLRTLRRTLGDLPLIAEDLGEITPAVERLRRRHRLPGMRVLQFAFDGSPHNPYLPHNHSADSVVYTGTHDNDTLKGWLGSLAPAMRAQVIAYFDCGARGAHEALLRAAYQSVARLSVIPMQDLLRLDSRHRMNVPGSETGNWRWRLRWEQVPLLLPDKLRRWAELYGRAS